jgi:hypothetical protein
MERNLLYEKVAEIVDWAAENKATFAELQFVANYAVRLASTEPLTLATNALISTKANRPKSWLSRFRQLLRRPQSSRDEIAPADSAADRHVDR